MDNIKLEKITDPIIELLDENEKMKNIIERIMTQHWDLDACPCWICKAARKINCYPRNKYLYDKSKGVVTVKAN